MQIQSFSVHDGEGIRTVIFLPGCPLRCQWCANPESWTARSKLAFYADKCQTCQACRQVCLRNIYPAQANAVQAGCVGCGKCVVVCPHQALQLLCLEMSVQQVMKKIQREEIFYRYSGGGVTFSGGEPTCQQDFLRLLVQLLEQAGINMWIETSGYFNWSKVRDIFSRLNHVFFDLKCMDSLLHQQLTGVDNKDILANAVSIHTTGLPMTVRIPCVKGANFTQNNLEQTALFMKEHLPGTKVELLPYHNLGREKYLALHMQEHLYAFTAPTQAEMQEALAIFAGYGVKSISYK